MPFAADGSTDRAYGPNSRWLDFMRSATHNVEVLQPTSGSQHPERVATDIVWLTALVDCLQRYVEQNRSRFKVLETRRADLRIQTFVRTDEKTLT